MANFSKYLGKEERVLNSIDMKDESVWAGNNMVASEYKSWTTLVVTNKRLFSLSRRKLNMKEFRLEDIVSTGWTYRPQWGKVLWGFAFLIAALLIYINIDAIGYYAAQIGAIYFGTHTDAEVVAMLTLWALFSSLIFGMLAIICFFSYFLLKRTTLRMTTKDGREYMFLIRGRRGQIDEFRMAVQDAKDLYFEETENRYFDKMRTVLFDQSNYEYALNNAKAAEAVETSESEKLSREDREAYVLWERQNAKLSGANAKAELGGSNSKGIGGNNQFLLPEIVMQLNSDGTLQLEDGNGNLLTSGDGHLLTSGGNNLLDSGAAAEIALSSKAADLLSQMGFEVSELTGTDADFLLFRDNVRYVAVVDETEFDPITIDKISKVIEAKNRYKTDIGLFISAGDLTEEVQGHANQNGIKIVYIKKVE